MKIECKDLERVLYEQAPEELRALELHAETCAACRKQLELERETSAAARALHRTWDSPKLWPRIRESLAAEAKAAARAPKTWTLGWPWLTGARQWQVAVTVVALLVVSAVGARMLLHRAAPQPVADRQLLTGRAAREVEKTETAYIASIDKLEKLAEPQLQNPTSALMASYREKLLLIDSAIAECRAQIQKNRWNAHLREDLLSIYQEKQRTLQEILRGE